MRRLSIRWRLTLWYGTVLSVILTGFSGAVYLLMQRHLLTLTDAALSEELDELADEVRRVTALPGLARVAEAAISGPRGLRVAGWNCCGRAPVPESGH